MATSGKEGKEKKSAKDDSAVLLRRLADELAALRADVEALKAPSTNANPAWTTASPSTPSTPDFADLPADSPMGLMHQIISRRYGPKDATVAIGIGYRLDGSAPSEYVNITGDLKHVLDVDDQSVARLAYALSSVPKVAIVRALLWEGAQSAAQLGEKAGLTTGSLYHHLRELTHAGVIEAAGRNRFVTTGLGIYTALVLFAQAKPIDKRGWQPLGQEDESEPK